MNKLAEEELKKNAMLVLSESDNGFCKVEIFSSPTTPDPILAMITALAEIVSNRQDILVQVSKDMATEAANQPEWATKTEGTA